MIGTLSISNKRLRELERIAHIVGGLLLLLYVYGPFGDLTWFTLAVRAIVFPMVVGSGFAMWQFPRVRRWWHARRVASEPELERPG